jgi:two-component system, OmpR family, alkaline phosphatase synthesis response regulator PhoP
MKILLVDDDDSILKVFGASLKAQGFEVITASNGNQGIEKAKQNMPDLVLLDQVLPDIQGNEILHTLKNDPQTKDLTIAMLSNFGQNDLIQKAINEGAVDYLLKYQITPDYLGQKVKEILGVTDTDTGGQQPPVQ